MKNQSVVKRAEITSPYETFVRKELRPKAAKTLTVKRKELAMILVISDSRRVLIEHIPLSDSSSQYDADFPSDMAFAAHEKAKSFGSKISKLECVNMLNNQNITKHEYKIESITLNGGIKRSLLSKYELAFLYKKLIDNDLWLQLNTIG